MSKIYGFGSVALDFRGQVADFGKDYTSKLLVQKTDISAGGAVANSLVQAARLGGHAVYLGKLGTDEIGRRIVANLRAENIDTESIIFGNGEISPFNVAIYAGEARRRVGGYLLPNSLFGICAKDVERLSSRFSEGDILLLEIGEIAVESCLYMCRIAKEKGVRIVMDVDLDPVLQCGAKEADARTLFSYADYLIPNGESLKSLFGEIETVAAAQKLSEEYRAFTVITEGDKGCVFCDLSGKAKRQKSFKISSVVDTVGAGDAFHGSFAYALSQNYPPETAVLFATYCAAQNCKAFGATTAMARRSELENIWDFGAGRFIES